MRVMYVTARVLGDAGANAAELFPKLAQANDAIDKVIVADFPTNKRYIKEEQRAEFLALGQSKNRLLKPLRDGARLARKAKADDIDIVHFFYRQRNIPMVMSLRVALLVLRARTRVVMDHRSVEILGKGYKSFLRRLSNQLMQFFIHDFAGNPAAVETNNFWVWRRKHLIDLGYDTLPTLKPRTAKSDTVNVWYVGTMKPRNRKFDFLLSVFQGLQDHFGSDAKIRIQVAGTTNQRQAWELGKVDLVTYHGTIPRTELYDLMASEPGVGIAFMNVERHHAAPSLKFVEYAAMGFPVVASNTPGLQMQAERMRYRNVSFVEQNVEEWVAEVAKAVEAWPDNFETWPDRDLWSYAGIFDRQVLGTYRAMLNGRR